MYVPSLLHAIALLDVFARKLTGLLSPPAMFTTCTLEKFLGPASGVYATQRLSGENAMSDLPRNGARLNSAVASSRSLMLGMSSTRSSRASRVYTMRAPSGDHFGDTSLEPLCVS